MLSLKNNRIVFNDLYYLNVSKFGTNTNVHRASRVDDESKECMIKVYRNNYVQGNIANLMQIQEEIQILQRVNHPNIIKYIGHSFPSRRIAPISIYLIHEFAPMGDLFDYCKRYGPLSETESRIHFSQLCDAVEYLHGHGIAHLNLKLENILLDEDWNIKLSGFDYAT